MRKAKFRRLTSETSSLAKADRQKKNCAFSVRTKRTVPSKCIEANEHFTNVLQSSSFYYLNKNSTQGIVQVPFSLLWATLEFANLRHRLQCTQSHKLRYRSRFDWHIRAMSASLNNPMIGAGEFMLNSASIQRAQVWKTNSFSFPQVSVDVHVALERDVILGYLKLRHRFSQETWSRPSGEGSGRIPSSSRSFIQHRSRNQSLMSSYQIRCRYVFNR